MNESMLKDYLQQADAAMPLAPVDVADVASGVVRRLNRRKRAIRYGMPVAAAIVIVAGLWGGQFYQSHQKQRHIVQLEKQVRELTEQTQAILAKIEQLLDDQQTRLQAITRTDEPAYKIETAIDEAAFILMYQAERMTEKYNKPDDAADYYRQVIKYFGQTPSAKTAKERLNELELNEQQNHI